MAYTMPDKIEDDFENTHGFRSQDVKTLAILILFWIFFTVFFIKGIMLSCFFLLFLATPFSYWLHLPAKKFGKGIRNWQVYYNYCFRDKKVYREQLEEKENYEI